MAWRLPRPVRTRKADETEEQLGHAEQSLQYLLAASIIFPLLIFTIASWIAYQSTYREAEDRLQRTLGTIFEHATKVFDTFDVSSRYLDELLATAPIEEIRANEGAYSSKLRGLIDTLPQLRDLWIIDPDGHPVVSGTVQPLPPLDLSDREYFSVHKTNQVQGDYVSELLTARAAETNFFAITRKRLDADGRFAGVVLVSIAPEYFTNYYASLPDDDGATYALYRADGVVLSRDPVPAASRLPDNSPVLAAFRASDHGTLKAKSLVDGRERIYAYRKLARYDAFVVSTIETSAVVNDWLRTMSYHLIFGLPATLAMISFAWLALRRTQQESVAYARLRQEVARREVTEQALRQAQKMEAVGRLTGGIAHDFNNLLTVILGNIDMATRRLSANDEQVRRALSAARRGSQRAATLVQRLLAFSRQHPQEVRAVDVNGLVKGMSEILHRSIGETINIETVLASGLWRAALDPNQLENAILNMAVNSRDAMPEGGRLTIETANTSLDEAYVAREGGGLKAGQYVMLAISDTGVGMAKEVRESAFEPFYTTKPTGAGSGLGLSMVYGFVKQSGGHIKIYSEEGQGTSIKLYFPRVTEKSELPVWPVSDAGEEKPTTHIGSGLTILIVEDDEDVRRFTADALRDHGYLVETVGDGASALAALRNLPNVALLFTDVVLPGGMNGREIAAEAIKIRPSLQVLFATGYTRNAIIHHGRLDAGVELLTKPFTVEALTRKIAQMLGSGPASK